MTASSLLLFIISISSIIHLFIYSSSDKTNKIQKTISSILVCLFTGYLTIAVRCKLIFAFAVSCWFEFIFGFGGMVSTIVDSNERLVVGREGLLLILKRDSWEWNSTIDSFVFFPVYPIYTFLFTSVLYHIYIDRVEGGP